MRAVAVALIAAPLWVALAWGGYTLYSQSACENLEDDFLNSVAGMERTLATYPAEKMKDWSAEAHETALKVHADAIAQYSEQIKQNCGQRAWATASRKAQGSIF